MKNRMCLIGSNIQKSKSPLVYKAISSYFDEEIEYDLIDIEPNSLKKLKDDEKTNEFLSLYDAINLTSPFKNITIDGIVDSQIVVNSQSKNLIINNEGLYSHDTDGRGLLNDFAYNKIELKRKSILIFGSGCVVRSIISAMKDDGLYDISLYHRNVIALKEIELMFPHIRIINDEYLNYYQFDIIINATPVLPHKINSLYLHKGCVVYDLTTSITSFRSYMFMQGIKSLNGYGMLKEQAILNYNLVYNKLITRKELELIMEGF